VYAVTNKISLNDRFAGRKNNYDFIRFVAAVFVLISHAYPLTSHGDELLKVMTNGQMSFGTASVAVFFMISGFLIMQSFDRAKNIQTFFLARILRIFPGLLVAVLICAFIIGPLVTTLPLEEYLTNRATFEYLKVIFLFPMHWTLPGVFEHLSDYNSINGSLWTIPFEVLCYVFVAIIGVLRINKQKKAILLIFLLSVYARAYLKGFAPQVAWVYVPSLYDLFPYFAAGMLFYSFREQIVFNKWYATIAGLLLLLSAKFGGLNLTFIAVVPYLVFYFAYNEKLPFANFGKYGDLSYGIYIYAFPIQQTVMYLLDGRCSVLLNIVISLPITLIIAYFSWHLVEKRALRYKNLLVPRQRHTTSV
jgi:peptidoglycan/LPS O-acetylase OafA/YrhL